MRLFYRLFLIIGLCSFAAFTVYGQGAILDRDFYNQLPRQPNYGDGSKSESKALEGINKVDLKPYCPTVQHQGTMSSCTGWAVGYAAQTIQYAISKEWKGKTDKITNRAFSALFLYNLLKEEKIESCGVGTNIGKALELLQDKGNIHSEDFDTHRDCNRQPSDKELAYAQNYKIKNFVTLFPADERGNIVKHKVKLSLAQGMPVIVGIPITKKFQKLKTSFWYPSEKKQPAGHHAMVVVGFDDKKGAFEIMNSWGKGWGNDGFFWMKYDDFAKSGVFAFQLELFDEVQLRIYPSISEDKGIPIEADFTLSVPSTIGGFTIFNNPEFKYKEHEGIFYTKDTLVRSDIAQFTITNVTERTYLYMFSFDADENINVHWPRDEVFDDKFTGLHESALITVPEVELVLPTPNSAFQFNLTGNELFCILLSRSPITDFNEKLPSIKENGNEDLHQRLNEVFGEKVLNMENAICRSGKTSRFSSNISESNIVPVIFKIPVEH